MGMPADAGENPRPIDRPAANSNTSAAGPRGMSSDSGWVALSSLLDRRWITRAQP